MKFCLWVPSQNGGLLVCLHPHSQTVASSSWTKRSGRRRLPWVLCDPSQKGWEADRGRSEDKWDLNLLNFQMLYLLLAESTAAPRVTFSCGKFHLEGLLRRDDRLRRESGQNDLRAEGRLRSRETGKI